MVRSLPASGKPIAVIPSIGVPLMRDCYVGDLRSWTSPAETDDGISLLVELIHDHVGNSDRLGMMMGRETFIRMPLADIRALRAQLDGITMADMAADIQQIRMIKSPAEQEKLKHICGTVSRVFATIPNWVDAGVGLDELFRQFKIKALEAGVDDVSYLVGSAGLGGYKDIIAPPSSRPLASGMCLCLTQAVFGMAISAILIGILQYTMLVSQLRRRTIVCLTQPKRLLIS